MPKNSVVNPVDNGEPCRSGSLVDCVSNWMRSADRNDAPVEFDRMLEAWGAPGVVSALAFLNRRGHGECAKRVRGARSLESVRHPVQTVATYYHRYADGGVERVLSLLTGVWRDMGYDVVLLTDEPPSSDDYELPEGVRRVVIPACRITAADSYENRARALTAALRENEVDALVYHAWLSPLMLWDLLVCRLSDVSFFVHCHGIFSQPARKAMPYFADMPAVYALADGVVTLGDVNREYWSRFNTNVTDVVNPLSFEPAQTPCADLSGKTVLWIGRLCDEKRPRDALRIFAKVLEREPDARMEMVGGSFATGYLQRLQKLARRLGIEDAVSMHGFHKDVMPFYERASVFLMTSEYEGSPMVLTESQAWGLPCVMYELPYLTAVRTGRGIVSVERGDIDRAADAVADILADREYRLKLGRDARANAEDLAAFDFPGVWRGVFDGSPTARGHSTPESSAVMWETLLDHYRIGARARTAELAKLREEIAFGAGLAGMVRRMRRGLRRTLKRLLRPKP